MIINELYEYAQLDRKTEDTGERVYVTPSGGLPSVTTILSKTGDKSGLQAWIDRVGEKRANQIRDEASGLGSLTHDHLEKHILGEERPGGTNLVRQMAKDMADTIIDHGLTQVNEVWGMEAPLYYPGLYAGTADLIGLFNNKPAIMDFKTTNRMKSESMITDYFCQCIAYAEAHNELFGTDIHSVAIFMVSRNLEFKTFTLDQDQYKKYRDVWFQRVAEFYDV